MVGGAITHLLKVSLDQNMAKKKIETSDHILYVSRCIRTITHSTDKQHTNQNYLNEISTQEGFRTVKLWVDGRNLLHMF